MNTTILILTLTVALLTGCSSKENNYPVSVKAENADPITAVAVVESINGTAITLTAIIRYMGKETFRFPIHENVSIRQNSNSISVDDVVFYNTDDIGHTVIWK